MHLAIDAVGARRGGAASVLRSVLEAVQQTDHFSRVTVFAPPETPLETVAGVSVLPQPQAASLSGRYFWLRGGLARAVAHQNAHALLCLNNGGFGPLGVVSGTLLQQPVPFSHEALARFRARERLRLYLLWRAMRTSCQRCDLVFVQTPTMAQWVRRDFQIPEQKLRIVTPTPPELPASGSPSPRLSVMREAKGLRLLLVSDDYPHKNAALLAEAVLKLRATHADARAFLTYRTDHPLSRVPGITCLGSLSPQEVREAYTLASALVMPSVVESVGLPLLEAASLGVPVLAADRPYAHDVCQEAALYFDPLSPEALIAQIRALEESPELRERLVRAGQARIRSLAQARPYQAMLESLYGLVATSAGAAK